MSLGEKKKNREGRVIITPEIDLIRPLKEGGWRREEEDGKFGRCPRLFSELEMVHEFA